MDADISVRQSERFRKPLHGARAFNDLANVRGDNPRPRADGPGSIQPASLFRPGGMALDTANTEPGNDTGRDKE